MKNLFTFFLCSLLLTVNLSATNVSGPITTSTTWTVANSPYIVTGNILVMEGVTLTIEPGVEVRFDASKVLQVNGTLVARGTAADSIRFTSNTTPIPGAWGYIYFTDSSVDATLDNNGNYTGGSILEFCAVEYGGSIAGDFVPMINLSDAYPFIQHTNIRRSTGYGIGVNSAGQDQPNYSLKNNSYSQCWTGIFMSALYCKLSISNSTFYDNVRGIYGNGYLVLDSNTFYNNSNVLEMEWQYPFQNSATVTNNEFAYNGLAAPDSLHPQIFLADALVLIVGALNFSNNLCHHNEYNLLYKESYGECKISSNIFTDNVADGDRYLLRIGYFYNEFEDTLLINNNIITNNLRFQAIDMTWSCCIHYTKVANNVFINNYVNRELLSIYSSDGYPVDVTDNIVTQNMTTGNELTLLAGAIKLNNNSFYRNNAAHILKNKNSPAYQPYLDINNNYWGLETPEELSEAILDFFDDANLGITVYDSILLAPNASNPVLPPASVIKTDMGNNSIKISWLPNPEADIKGYNVYWGKYSGYTFEHMANAGLNTSYTIEGASVGDTIAVTAYDNDYVPGKNTISWLNENMLNGHESAYSFELHFPLGFSKTENTPEFSLYPVPAHEKFTVELKKLDDANFLVIINMQGKSVKTLQLTDAKTEVGIGGLPDGMYMVKLSSRRGVWIKKIIVM